MREGYSRRLLQRLKVTAEERGELEEHRFNTAAEVRTTSYFTGFKTLFREAMVSGAHAAWSSFADCLPFLVIALVAAVLAAVTQVHTLIWFVPMTVVWLCWLLVRFVRSYGKTKTRRHK